MKKLVAVTVLSLSIAGLISACGKGGDSDQVVVLPQGSSMMAGAPATPPGLIETQKMCSQCHALPSPTQHHPAAWPGIVARMENHMVASKRPTPSPQEREAILGYLQGGWQK